MQVKSKPFFPIGLYLHENSPQAIEDAAKAGMNLVLMPPASENKETRERVALSRKLGLQVILETEVAPGTPKEIEANADKVVSRFKDLPLLAWTGVDEPDLKPAYKNVLSTIHAEMARHDGRPLYQANHTPQSFWTAGTACDILAVDPYPLSAIPRPITTVGEWIDEAREAVGPGHAVWLVQQAFAEAPLWPKAPTPEQLHAMTWIALNHGAQGIVYYTLHEILDPAARDNDFKWDLRRTPLWAEISREAKEMSALQRFLLRPQSREKLFALRGTIDGNAWVDDKGTALVALVNVTDSTSDAQLRIPVDHLRIYPEGPEIFPQEGTIGVRLPPYGVLLLTGRARR